MPCASNFVHWITSLLMLHQVCNLIKATAGETSDDTKGNDDITRVLILGQSGHGKSTTINNVFKASKEASIGHGLSSETKTVSSYHSLIDKNDYLIYDTPGFYDTDGLTTDEILEFIDIELQMIDTQDTSNIDSILFVVSTNKNRDSSTQHLLGAVTLLSDKMLESLIVVINHFAKYDKCEMNSQDDNTNIMSSRSRNGQCTSDMQKTISYIEGQLKMLVAMCKDCNKNIKIPLVTINCLNPTDTQLKNLFNTIRDGDRIKPYELRHLNNAKEEIQLIYNKILDDPSSYKDQINTIVKNETAIITKQALKRIADTINVKKCYTTGKNYAGIYKSSKIKCVTEQAPVQRDVVVDLQEEQIIQVPHEVVEKVLKNEKSVYWEVAKREYKKQVYQRIKGKNKEEL